MILNCLNSLVTVLVIFFTNLIPMGTAKYCLINDINKLSSFGMLRALILFIQTLALYKSFTYLLTYL